MQQTWKHVCIDEGKTVLKMSDDEQEEACWAAGGKEGRSRSPAQKPWGVRSRTSCQIRQSEVAGHDLGTLIHQ